MKSKRVYFSINVQSLSRGFAREKDCCLGTCLQTGKDDMREATSLVTIDRLLREGCKVRMYDPVAMEECRRRWAGVWNMPQTCMILSWKWMLY